MTNKTFTISGVSSINGKYKVRFGNDMSQRIKVLQKANSDIQLIELPHAMTKPDLVTYLKTTDLYNNPAYRTAIDTADKKYNPVFKVKRTRVSKKQKETV